MKEVGELESKQKYSDAIKLLNETIKAYPKLVDAYLSRGADKSEINDCKGGINDYNKVLELDPKNTLALFNIGNNYKTLNENLKAISYYNRAFATKGGERIHLDMTPNNFVNSSNYDVVGSAIFFERGLAYFRVDSLKKSFIDLRQCVSSNYRVKDSYYFIGIIYEEYQMKNDACKCLLKSAQLGDEDAPAELKKYCHPKN